MEQKIKKNWKIILSAFLFIFIIGGLFYATYDADAAVKVKGYYRKDGTYVQPHYRSNPDSNPYNNWSFPGNVNPYTEKVAPGNPDTYLENYYKDKGSLSLPSYSLPSEPASVSSSSPQSPLSINGLSSLPNNALIRRENGTKVYKVIDGKKYWITTAKRFEAFNYKWTDVLVVQNNLTDDNHDGVLTYAEGTLVKSPIYPFVWLIKENSTRKWISTAKDFENCGFKWYNIFTIPEEEIQSLHWDGNNTNGTVIYPACN